MRRVLKLHSITFEFKFHFFFSLLLKYAGSFNLFFHSFFSPPPSSHHLHSLIQHIQSKFITQSNIFLVLQFPSPSPPSSFTKMKNKKWEKLSNGYVQKEFWLQSKKKFLLSKEHQLQPYCLWIKRRIAMTMP